MGALIAGLVAAPVDAVTNRPPRPSSAVAAGTHGASGIGDRYFPLDGNGGYDVSHYRIADTYDTPSDALSGTTTVTAKATQNLTRFDLDIVLSVDSVSVNGEKATFQTHPHELVITPAEEIHHGDTFTVEVSYHGTPHTITYGGEQPWIWDGREALSTNEPHIAPWWFAANDHPTDKATYDITVSVPKGEQVVSNGTLVSSKQRGGDDTFHWRMTTPIASYLAFFAAGRYAIRTGTKRGLPYTIAASKDLPDPKATLRVLAHTSAIVAWEVTQFGAYPFTSTGGLVTGTGRGFSLEDASRPTYSATAGISTMVHELAHQWFGDDVSVHRWRDIWLNEGFASYAQWRYSETHGGAPMQQQLLQQYDAFPANDPFWQLIVGNPGANDIFDDPIYTRGAMALAALRHRIGDDDFETLLKTWVVDHTDANGSIAQFEKLAGSVSGQQLGGFFKAWLFTGAKPAKTKQNGF